MKISFLFLNLSFKFFRSWFGESFTTRLKLVPSICSKKLLAFWIYLLNSFDPGSEKATRLKLVPSICSKKLHCLKKKMKFFHHLRNKNDRTVLENLRWYLLMPTIFFIFEFLFWILASLCSKFSKFLSLVISQCSKSLFNISRAHFSPLYFMNSHFDYYAAIIKIKC